MVLLAAAQLLTAIAAAQPLPPNLTPPQAPAATPVLASDVDQPTYRLAAQPDGCAVVIGVERYQRLPPAAFAGRDADAVRAHLLALGYPAAQVRLVTGGDAARAGIAEAVETWLPACVKKDRSAVFFYFAGRGAPDPMSGAQYLLPSDGDPARLDDSAYSVFKLYSRLTKLRARRVVVVLDAGFSGEGPRSAQAPDARHLVTGAAATGVPARLNALLAATIDQSAGVAPDQGHGLLTYYLLKDLNRSAGQASLRELADYVGKNVSADARLAGREQTPQLFSREDAALSGR